MRKLLLAVVLTLLATVSHLHAATEEILSTESTESTKCKLTAYQKPVLYIFRAGQEKEIEVTGVDTTKLPLSDVDIFLLKARVSEDQLRHLKGKEYRRIKLICPFQDGEVEITLRKN